MYLCYSRQGLKIYFWHHLYIAQFLQSVCATNEELLEESLLCNERHQLETQTLELSLREKLENVEKLTKERKSLDETVQSYKIEIERLKSEMDRSLKNKKETIDKLE